MGLVGRALLKTQVHPDQAEGLLEDLEGPVPGTVADHDDLKLRVAEGQEGPHRGGDGLLLVIGGDQDGNGQVGLPLQEVLEGKLRKLPGVAGHHPEAKEGEGGVEEVEDGEIVENQDLIAVKKPG
jgi:hypothetical protein